MSFWKLPVNKHSISYELSADPNEAFTKHTTELETSTHKFVIEVINKTPSTIYCSMKWGHSKGVSQRFTHKTYTNVQIAPGQSVVLNPSEILSKYRFFKKYREDYVLSSMWNYLLIYGQIYVEVEIIDVDSHFNNNHIEAFEMKKLPEKDKVTKIINTQYESKPNCEYIASLQHQRGRWYMETTSSRMV